MAKKITIKNTQENQDEKNVSVKPSKRFQILRRHKEKIDNEIKELYESKESDRLYQPKIIGNKLWAVVIIAIIVSLISSIFVSFYILTKKQITLPWGAIDLTAYFPVSQTTIVREQSVTVSFDERVGTMRNELDTKIVRIFNDKTAPENVTAPFLEQIYMPDEVVAQGVIITGDGWIMIPIELSPPLSFRGANEVSDEAIPPIYMVVDNELQEFAPQDMFISNGFTFIKIEKQTNPIAFSTPDEIMSGRQVFLIDKVQNTHFAKISQAQYRSIETSEDLVRSTDEFFTTIVLDNAGLLRAFPSTYIYGLGGKALGAIQDGQVIPLWRIADKINQALQGQTLKYPYLGIDYVRIEQAPGLVGSLFKDLKNGAVVYGPPAPGSPADKAGIKNADVILSVDDVVLDKHTNFTYLIQSKNPGDTVVLTFLRKGEEMTVEVELGPHTNQGF